jgi:MFS transporter, SP family, arabinose:H+ symporter
MNGAPLLSTGKPGPLIVSTLVSSLGGFLFGYDNIVISGAIGHLSTYFRLQTGAIGWAAGCALIGCLIGSACSGSLADRFGLKKALYGCAACFALSSVGVWLSPNFTQYVLWRIVGGIGIGAASIVAPMYIAEIAPAAVRGRLVVFYQFGIVSGILCAVFINMLIERSGDEAWNISHGWRWMFAVGAIPAAIFVLTILFARESPRWLMKVGREREAEKVLVEIQGTRIAIPEATSIRNSLTQEKGGLRELFAGPFRRALLIGFLLAAFSQTSGITALLSFLPEIFKSAGEKSADAFFQSVLVGLVNLALTLVAIWLVDRAGRRTLILCGTALQAAALASVGCLYFAQATGMGILIGIMVFVAGHAIGNGAVCWVIISEIFPTKVRGAAMSIATTAIWVFAYLTNQFFPIMRKYLGNDGMFWFFAAMAGINFMFVLKMVPETKGYSLEHISRIWAEAKVTDDALGSKN